MNKSISNTQKEDPDKSKIQSEEVQESINPFHHEMNTNEGSEFLDDAIRMDDDTADNNWASIEQSIK